MSIQQEIRELKRERNAIILAHTYQPAEVQDIADFVGDSYGLSVEAATARADVIIFCGVMFMAETAALLNPSRTVIIPEPTAGCPMADMIEPEDLVALKEKHPGHVVMCYVNSTAAIKALSDICCTSANALAIARQIPAERGIIFVPDEHLGDYVAEETGRDIVLWKGFCPTHLRITEKMLRQARAEHPKAAIVIHPEATRACRHLADQVLSTGGMCRFVKADPAHQEYVIATEIGIIHTLQKQNPAKRFFALSDRISCPNMKKGSLLSVKESLEGRRGMVVKVPEDVAAKARRCLEKMLEMSKGV